MGKGLLGGAGGGDGIPKEGLLGSGTMPCVFAEAGMEHSKKIMELPSNNLQKSP